MPSTFDTPANPEPEPPPRRVSPDDHLRVGDVERQEALTVINQSYGEGRIDLQEMERRTAHAAAAVTRGDLQSATSGLPNTQRIAQSFASRLDELIAADLQRDVEQRQSAAAQEEAGAQEAADAAARLFREFATRLKGILPPRPVHTSQFRASPKKLFSRSSPNEEIISPPGYQLYPDPGLDKVLYPGVHGPHTVTVCDADGRIWQSEETGEKGELGRPKYRTGYVDITPQLLFGAGPPGQFSLVRGGVLFHRAGLPWLRGSEGGFDNHRETEIRLDDALARLAAEMIQRWRLGSH